MSQQQQQSICPIMSSATIEREKLQPPKLTVPGQKPHTANPTFVPCLGTNCAFFVPLMNDKNQVVGGGCGVALFPSAVMGLKESVEALHDTIEMIGVADGKLPAQDDSEAKEN